MRYGERRLRLVRTKYSIRLVTLFVGWRFVYCVWRGIGIGCSVSCFTGSLSIFFSLVRSVYTQREQRTEQVQWITATNCIQNIDRETEPKQNYTLYIGWLRRRIWENEFSGQLFCPVDCFVISRVAYFINKSQIDSLRLETFPADDENGIIFKCRFSSEILMIDKFRKIRAYIFLDD